MHIEAEPPYRTTHQNGASFAVKDHLQLTVTDDVGDHTVNHRFASKPPGKSERWLHAHLKEKGVHVFIKGTHVIVTATDRWPTFDLLGSEDLMELALDAMKIEKNERGAYVHDTPNNRRVLLELFERVAITERNRITAWAKTALAQLSAPKSGG